jgi:hypothetical protein
MRGANRPEVPVVDHRDVRGREKCPQVGSAEAFGDRDHGGVRRAQWEVGVLATRSAIQAKSRVSRPHSVETPDPVTAPIPGDAFRMPRGPVQGVRRILPGLAATSKR